MTANLASGGAIVDFLRLPPPSNQSFGSPDPLHCVNANQRRPSTAPPMLTALDFHSLPNYLGDHSSYAYSPDEALWFAPEAVSISPSSEFDCGERWSRSPSEDIPCRPQLSRKAKSEENKILRPPNAWILYRSDKLAELKLAVGRTKTPQAEMSKRIAEQWKLEPVQTRRYYDDLAKMRKAEHEAAYPDYKYKPKRKNERPSTANSTKRSRLGPKPISHAGSGKLLAAGFARSEQSDSPVFTPLTATSTMQHSAGTSGGASPQDVFFYKPDLNAAELPNWGEALSASSESSRTEAWLSDTTSVLGPPALEKGGWQVNLGSLPAWNTRADNFASASSTNTEALNPFELSVDTAQLQRPDSVGNDGEYQPFVAPAADYKFPASASSTAPTSAAPEFLDLTRSEELDWTAFRNVKVRLDPENGVALETLLRQLQGRLPSEQGDSASYFF